MHLSLLPRHRGASPIQAAILAGDPETGVSIQRVVLALDAGDVVHAVATPIGPEETAGELGARLAELGARAAVEALDAIEAGTARFTPQDPERVTVCRKLKKEHGHLDWARPAPELERFVRAMAPWPGAHTRLPEQHGGKGLTVRRARLPEGLERPAAARPGELLEVERRLCVACGEGALELLEVQVPGKRALPVPEFLRGARLQPGEHLGV